MVYCWAVSIRYAIELVNNSFAFWIIVAFITLLYCLKQQLSILEKAIASFLIITTAYIIVVNFTAYMVQYGLKTPL